MSKKVEKEEYILDDDSIEDTLVDEDEESEEEEIEYDIKQKSKEEFDKIRLERRIKKEERENEREVHKEQLEKAILKILKKGTVVSKMNLTHLLIKAGIKNYDYKFNIFENDLQFDIPQIGSVLKKLRFEKKIDFSMYEGSHVFFTYFKNKKIKVKKPKSEFDWRFYDIPFGKNEIYMVFKIPGTHYKAYHLLSSCFPSAKFLGFKINVDRKYEKTGMFTIKKGNLDGWFDEDKLILRCHTSHETITKTLFKINKIGKRLVRELLMMNRRFSEVITIHNKEDSLFIPVVPVFNAIDKALFYETKSSNVLRGIYDFPKKFEKKNVYGRYSLLVFNEKGEDFDITNHYEFIEDSFKFEVKAFISNSIMNNWIINPTKALNYTGEDDELTVLINEYLQDIDTDRIIREKLEKSMEKSVFIKDMTTNLLLTLLGLSILTNEPVFQWIIIGAFVLINAYYLYSKSKRSRKIHTS